jgi:hypothetical protein
MYPTTHPRPVSTSVKRHASGLAHVKLMLHEDDVLDCRRCSRCASKIKVADAELGHLHCGHRMPSTAVPTFIFGPTTNVPDHADIETVDAETAWPNEASVGCINILGRKAMIFAWSNAAWSVEPHKPPAWPIRDGRLWVVPDPSGPSPPISVGLWAGRADRACVAPPTLDLEVNLGGLLAVYTVAPRLDDVPDATSHAVPLVGNGGVPCVDIILRADLFKTLNGYPG